MKTFIKYCALMGMSKLDRELREQMLRDPKTKEQTEDILSMLAIANIGAIVSAISLVISIVLALLIRG